MVDKIFQIYSHETLNVASIHIFNQYPMKQLGQLQIPPEEWVGRRERNFVQIVQVCWLDVWQAQIFKKFVKNVVGMVKHENIHVFFSLANNIED